MRTYYAHIVDVLRKYNPQLTEENITEDDDLFLNKDEEQLLARLEAVESDFESSTGKPFREVRVGEPERKSTWETKSADYYRSSAGIKYWLNNMEVAPLDPELGDAVEMRVGRNRWRDITDLEGNRYEVHHRDGWLRIFSRYRANIWRVSTRDRSLRITYRHGALSGRHDRAGQTYLDGQVVEGDTELTVRDSTRVPSEGILKVGNEYVHATSRDVDSDTITVSRGVRGTTEKSHDDTTVVHFCPVDIRDAVAAKSAIELLAHEGWVTELSSGDGFSASEKREAWMSEWESALKKYAGVRSV